MAHEIGSLSWAAVEAEKGAVMDNPRSVSDAGASWQETKGGGSPATGFRWVASGAPVPACSKFLTGWFIKTPAPEPETETEDMPIEQFLDEQWAAQSHVDRHRRRERDFEARRVCYLYPNDKGELEEFCADRAWRSADTGAVYSSPGIDGDWTEPTHVRMRKRT